MSDQNDITNQACDAAMRQLWQGLAMGPYHTANSMQFLAEWTRQLADTVQQHSYKERGRYGDKVQRWAGHIAASSDPARVRKACRDIHEVLEDVDNEDGWPADHSGCVLFSVTLCGLFSLGDQDGAPAWALGAADVVYDWATGIQADNAITRFSRRAWERHLYARVEGALSMRRVMAAIEERSKLRGMEI